MYLRVENQISKLRSDMCVCVCVCVCELDIQMAWCQWVPENQVLWWKVYQKETLFNSLENIINYQVDDDVFISSERIGKPAKK